MARIYLPPSTPPPDDKPEEKVPAEQAAAATPEPKQEQTVQLAEPAAATPPPANASKADWIDYAVTYRGADKDDAEASTKAALVDKYGRGPEGDGNG